LPARSVAGAFDAGVLDVGGAGEREQFPDGLFRAAPPSDGIERVEADPRRRVVDRCDHSAQGLRGKPEMILGTQCHPAVLKQGKQRLHVHGGFLRGQAGRIQHAAVDRSAQRRRAADAGFHLVPVSTGAATFQGDTQPASEVGQILQFALAQAVDARILAELNDLGAEIGGLLQESFKGQTGLESPSERETGKANLHDTGVSLGAAHFFPASGSADRHRPSVGLGLVEQ
jgi:hypothetical protein